jgi:hypothetical protein
MIPNRISQYFHCMNCISSGRKDKISVGWTPKGIQVWCDMCNQNVIAFDFKGQKIDYDELEKKKG